VTKATGQSVQRLVAEQVQLGLVAQADQVKQLAR